ncbi:MAG: hypothetical protein HY074_06095 [Deltaproteobacteria bacterium]|nr:hypothetical protein [Deltaproteobacteria bacterium]
MTIKSSLALVFLLSTTALANQNPFLTDSKGMTVYTFDRDTAGIPTCYDACAHAWPAVPVPTEALKAPFSAVVRKDGSRQLAHQGKPLYTFFQDHNPGDTTGDGLHGVWHIVRTQ